jgi:hypothetical protein
MKASDLRALLTSLLSECDKAADIAKTAEKRLFNKSCGPGGYGRGTLTGRYVPGSETSGARS